MTAADEITYVDAAPAIPGHLGTDAPHVHHRGSDACLRAPDGVACPTPAELRAEVARLRAGLYPLSQHTIEWAEGLASDIGASPDSLFVGWINERKRAESAEAEVERLTGVIADRLGEYALFGRSKDGDSTLTGDLAADMAAYTQRLKAQLSEFRRANEGVTESLAETESALASAEAEVERLRQGLQATATDAVNAKCARDAARREADQLHHLLGTHADGHRCHCEMTSPGSYNEPPEWEQNPWCPTHPDVDYILDACTKAEAERDRLSGIVTEAALETYTPDGSERFVGAFHNVLAERDALQQQVAEALNRADSARAMVAAVRMLRNRWNYLTTAMAIPGDRELVESVVSSLDAALGGPAAPTPEPVERITDDRGDELEHGADTDAEAANQPEMCPACYHLHTPDGCSGPPSPSDLWAGVTPSSCDCDWDRQQDSGTR